MKNDGVKILRKEELNPTIGIVVGTRPGIIKFSPIIRELQKRKINFFIVHTGQHYSYNMDKVFFQNLELPDPFYRVDITRKAKMHGAQTAEMLKGLEKVFVESKPRMVVVGGDANTNLAGALAARKLGIEVAHMEAGLRSDDWRMPEEHNRVMIDHISEILFAPTREAKKNLKKDNVKGKIYVVGNPIVDAVYQNLTIAQKTSDILRKYALRENGYFLLTIHREENVDHPNTFASILEGISETAFRWQFPLVFPVHPRTAKRIKEYGLQEKLDAIPHLYTVKPIGYLDFLMLLSNSRLVMTDSGGIQEECCILKVPCVTVRNNTERPETITVGANMLAGTSPIGIVDAIKVMLAVERNWPNPFGKGTTGKAIVKAILRAII